MDFVVWIIVAAVVVVLYAWYAAIVKRRNQVAEALSGIDVQLQQRHDLIPNMLKIARRFMEHERDLMERITALRGQAAAKAGARGFDEVSGKFAAEEQLGLEMGRFLALAENYPQLKSDGPMIEAQRSYQEVETNIAAARRFYNSSVAALKNAVQIFPGQLLMGLAGVSTLPPFFEKTERAAEPVDAAQHL